PPSAPAPRLIARSTVSFGMLAWRAASTAARNRGLAAVSGRPERAAVVNSRISLVKILPRFLSCAPLRYMMFLNCEWPAIPRVPTHEWLFVTGQRARPGHDPLTLREPARGNKPIWQDW